MSNSAKPNSSWLSKNKSNIFAGLGGLAMGGAMGAGSGGQGGGNWLSDFIYGKPSSMEKMPTMDPQQLAYLQQLMGGLGKPTGQGLDYISNILSDDPETMKAFEQPYMNQFNQETIPGIANTFSGSDSQGSSAFTNALGSAGSNLQQNLAGMRSNLKQGAMSQLQGFGKMGMAAEPFGYQKYDAQASPMAQMMAMIAKSYMGGM